MSEKKQFIDKFKKSLDFRNTTISIDSADQKLAEDTANPVVIDHIKFHDQNGVADVPFSKGILKLFKKEEGLFSAAFQDEHGQIIEKFDDMTAEMLAKNLMIRDLDTLPVYGELPQMYEYEDSEEEMEKEDEEEVQVKPTSIRIKYGDFELEIKKSIYSFLNDFKKSNINKDKLLNKALVILSKRHGKKNKTDMAKAISQDWEIYKEDLMQIIDALNRKDY